MILDKEFPPDPRVENEAISLINKGHKVFLFCLNYGDEKEMEQIKGIQIRRYISTKLLYKLSALVYTIPFYSKIMSKKISHFLNLNNIEAIHIHDIQIAEAVFNANKKLGLPTIIDLHENRPEIMKYYPHLQKRLGKLLISPKKWKRQEEKFISKATKVVVVTEESKNEIISRVRVAASKIVVVPNTVHKKYGMNSLLQEEIIEKYRNSFVLLYIGDTGLRRGLLTAIESVSLLKIKIKNIKLVIVGRNTSDNILKEKVNTLNLENYVDFEGWKDEKLFPSYIDVSEVCISPLHRNLHHDTTYANKIFQYMSVGKSLLVSDAIAQENIILKANSGLVHKAENIEDFAEKAIKLYKNEELRIAFGKNGKKFIENEFYWEKTSEKLIDLYRNLIE